MPTNHAMHENYTFVAISRPAQCCVSQLHMLADETATAPWARRSARTSTAVFESSKTNTNEDTIMPLVRIDISKTASRERVRDVGNAVYNAMITVANVPNYDKFQVVTRHEPDEIIYPEEGYLGIDYTPDLIIIQVTWVGGRSTDVKKKFYQHIADEIHAKQGVRKQDIWISLVDSGREDWSFGNGGEMRMHAPK